MGLVLLFSLTLSSCTDRAEPDNSSTPRRSHSADRGEINDVVVTQAAVESFIGMDASDAYAQLRRRHFKVRLGPFLDKFERNNIRGVATHPDVIIDALELTPQEVVVITKVSCTPRVAKHSRNYC